MMKKKFIIPLQKLKKILIVEVKTYLMLPNMPLNFVYGKSEQKLI